MQSPYEKKHFFKNVIFGTFWYYWKMMKNAKLAFYQNPIGRIFCFFLSISKFPMKYLVKTFFSENDKNYHFFVNVFFQCPIISIGSNHKFWKKTSKNDEKNEMAHDVVISAFYVDFYFNSNRREIEIIFLTGKNNIFPNFYKKQLIPTTSL